MLSIASRIAPIVNELSYDDYYNEEHLYHYFSSLETPILYQNMIDIKRITSKLSPFYKITEENDLCKYEVSIKKYDFESWSYIFTATIYLCQRAFIHFKIHKLEYTQYQIDNQICQIYDDHNIKMTKIYDLTNGYVYIDKPILIPNDPQIKYLALNVFKNLTFETDTSLLNALTYNNGRLKVSMGHKIKIIIKNKKHGKYIQMFHYLKNVEVTFEIISDHSQIILEPLFERKRIKKLHKILFDETINLAHFLNCPLNYIMVKCNYMDSIFYRKQIYSDSGIIFDGQSSHRNSSQLLISRNFKGLYVNELKQNNNTNMSKILINQLSTNPKLNLQIPNFLLNDEYLTKQYIGKEYNKFSVGKIINGNKYIVYSYKKNKIISKIINQLGKMKQIVYKNNQKISVYTKIVIDQIIRSKIYLLYDQYKIEYQKEENKDKILFCYKKIVRSDRVIFDGVYENGQTRVFNSMDSEDIKTLKCPSIISDNFICTFGFDFNQSKKKVECEKIISTDCKWSFEFSYQYIINFGNIIDYIKSIFVTKKSEDGSLESIDQYAYDQHHQKISKFIDHSNRLSVKSLSIKELKNGRMGYKAGVTKDHKMCIIKLFIPNDSKVCWDMHKDKYRTDKAIVLNIIPIYYSKNKYYYRRDLIEDECPICLDTQVTHISYPCRHKLCGDCWDILFKVGTNKDCPYCKSTIDKVEILPSNKPKIEDDEEITEAYSCVYTTNFVYRKNEQVTINNFDPDLSKVCAPGIHYEAEEKDVFKWFEYLDIPNEIITDSVPWSALLRNEEPDFEETDGIVSKECTPSSVKTRSYNQLGKKKIGDASKINEDIDFED